MNTTIQNLLNDQIKYEASASMQYLSMASWADANGLNGVADFFYSQSEEERLHMTKLVKFVNERGGTVVIPQLDKPKDTFKGLNELFETFLNSEMFVTEQINHIIFECQQLEEEAMARTLLDKLNIIGDDKSGHYLFDRDINTIAASQENEQ